MDRLAFNNQMARSLGFSYMEYMSIKDDPQKAWAAMRRRFLEEAERTANKKPEAPNERTRII